MDGAKTGPITDAAILLLPKGPWGASGHHPKTLGSQSWHFPTLLLRRELGLGLSFGIQPHLKWSCPKRDPLKPAAHPLGASAPHTGLGGGLTQPQKRERVPGGLCCVLGTQWGIGDVPRDLPAPPAGGVTC